MAGLSQNLDDGEFLLPRDIFFDEVPSTYGPYRISCMGMDEFARHFAALSLVRNHPTTAVSGTPQNPLPNSQLCKPAVRDFWVTHKPPPVHFPFNYGAQLGQSLRGYRRTGPGFPPSDPFYEIQVQQQVASYLETRAGVLQKQQSRLQNRVYPFQGSRFGHGGGFVRESGGTGVFHPRIVKPTTAAAATDDVEKKQGEIYRQQVLAAQERKSMLRVDVNRQEDCYYHLPPEMGLPQDWAY